MESRPMDDSSGPPNKRQRTSAMYERKRAVTACEPCRRRKTRCDNVRPICGFCQKNQGQCSYPSTTHDFATYDPASLAILDRINHVVSLLEGRPSHSIADLTTTKAGDSTPTPAPSHAATSYISPDTQSGLESARDPEPAGVHVPVPVVIDDGLFGSTDACGLPATNINCESILRWPIFRSSTTTTTTDANTSTVYSFVLDGADEDDSRAHVTAPPPPIPSRGIQEDDFQMLSRKFLRHVHSKNPILDIAEYRKYVKEAVEQGPRWDGPSCLVLITCALGCLSEPFDSEQVIDSPIRQETADSSHIDSLTGDMSTAQCYYLAAKKRLGLLRPSHLQIQCLFLFGVFEMYCLDPLQAWNYFNQACVQCRNLLWRRSQSQAAARSVLDPAMDQPVSRTARRLEQRLYWSCLKSELEVRCEIPLPQSGLANLNYPDLFPSPPTELSSPMIRARDLEDDLDDRGLEEQRSWFYYLAEISHRRMMNRAIMIMSPSSSVEQEGGWVKNIHENIQHAKDMNEQIDIWCSHVPPPINQEVSDHELAHFVQIRSVMCREWIHRPFLYYAIHKSEDDPYMEQALPLAEDCLRYCVDLIFRSPRHRQHGTWYVCRSSVSRSLLLVAAIKSGRLNLPDRWREALDVSRRILQRWKDDAPDLQRVYSVLDSLISEVHGSTAEADTL